MTGDSRVSELFTGIHRMRLENFCDDRFGFLKVAIEKPNGELMVIGEYDTIHPDALERQQVEAELFERVVIPIRQGVYA